MKKGPEQGKIQCHDSGVVGECEKEMCNIGREEASFGTNGLGKCPENVSASLSVSNVCRKLTLQSSTTKSDAGSSVALHGLVVMKTYSSF